MPAYIAMLRAINVGGQRKVAMADLRDCVSALGFDDVQTVLQTGNIVFRRGKKPNAALERQLEGELVTCLGLETDVFVRSASEWRTVVASNPFPAEARRDPGHLVVQFLNIAPRPKDVKALEAAIAGPELIRAAGKRLYLFYPAGIGRSKLTNKVLEHRLGVRGTGRNWNTILKLDALVEAR